MTQLFGNHHTRNKGISTDRLVNITLFLLSLSIYSSGLAEATKKLSASDGDYSPPATLSDDNLVRCSDEELVSHKVLLAMRF